MFISGLGLAPGAIYTSFMQRSQVHSVLTFKTFASSLTNLSIKALVSTKHPSHSPERKRGTTRYRLTLILVRPIWN
jgi:hypothetical protein